jgi:pilus assembly protein Flp/PilA
MEPVLTLAACQGSVELRDGSAEGTLKRLERARRRRRRVFFDRFRFLDAAATIVTGSVDGTNCAMTAISCNQGFTFYRYDSDRPPIWRTACARSSRLFRNEQKAKRMQKLLKDFIADESGATAIEYGLIAAGISLAIIAVVNGLGTKLNTKFTSINSSLK